MLLVQQHLRLREAQQTLAALVIDRAFLFLWAAGGARGGPSTGPTNRPHAPEDIQTSPRILWVWGPG